MSNSGGFTLVEVLVTSVLGALFASGILSIVYMTNDQVQEGIASARLAQQRQSVTEQILRSAHSAYGIKTSGDPAGPITGAFATTGLAGLPEIDLCDAAGIMIAGYKIQDSTLLEWVGGQFVPYSTGPDTVRVDSLNSSFEILPKRNGMKFQLRIRKSVAGAYYALAPIGQMVLCRNR